ncbi:hypothetical protein J4Q44_G00022520 [Coregonus suidteri]|uniref:Uncharacterized protein n=1 Tax=Coregonus suidteri TaxID=861788 RepID=A0AAN8MGE4_9TELE
MVVVKPKPDATPASRIRSTLYKGYSGELPDPSPLNPLPAFCVGTLGPFPNSGTWGWKTEIVPLKQHWNSSLLQTSAPSWSRRLYHIFT